MLRRIALGILWFFLALAPARADYRDVVPVLRIGMLETHPAMSDPVKIRTIEKAYEKATGIAVEIVRFPDLAALIDAHASARIQYAVHSALSFATTESVCGCVRPVRRAIGAEGRSGFRSVLVLRPGVEPAEARIAYSDRASLSGWIIPREAAENGSLEEGALTSAGSVRGAVEMLAEGKVDGLLGWLPEGGRQENSPLPERLFGGLYSEELGRAGELRIAWLSGPVYNGPHAVLRSLPDDLVEVLGAFLDAMPENMPGLLDILEPYNSGGYEAASSEDYRSLERLVQGLRDEAPALTGSTP
jgi:phosphonate transport system substrate-binding protein